MRPTVTPALLRRALDVLIEGRLSAYPTRQRPPRLVATLRRFRRRHAAWLAAAGFEAFGVGHRVRGGQPTRELVLKIYVHRKRPRHRLRRPVPRRISVPYLGTFATDVVALGRFKLHAFPEILRPVVPGSKISLAAGASGTLGCFVRSTAAGDAGATLLLTCAHVLTRDFRVPPDRAVMQATTAAQAASGNYQVATARRIVDLIFSEDPDDYSNEVDAGVAIMDPAIDVDPSVRFLNQVPAPTPGAISQDLGVGKAGWVSGLTRGKVVDTALKKSFAYPSVSGRRAGFSNLVMADYKSEEGDSGALVLDEAGRPVGIHMGGWDNYSLFCRFSRVMDLLEVAP